MKKLENNCQAWLVPKLIVMSGLSERRRREKRR